MFLKLRKAQSTGEYAILIGIVIAALASMQIYLKRGLQARVKAGTDAFTSINATIDAGTGTTVSLGSVNQYEPYYMESNYETYSEDVSQLHVTNGTLQVEKVADLTARGAGGYEAQKTAQNRTDKDSLWLPEIKYNP